MKIWKISSEFGKIRLWILKKIEQDTYLLENVQIIQKRLGDVFMMPLIEQKWGSTVRQTWKMSRKTIA